MSQEQPKPFGPPLDNWRFLGLALAVSGMFFHVAFIFGLYFLLKRARPSTGFALLAGISVVMGMALAPVFQGLIMHRQHYDFRRIVEPTFVVGGALALLLTLKRSWAWALIVYSVLGVFLTLLTAVFKMPREVKLQYLFIYAAAHLTVLWLLVNWLRTQKAAAPPPEEPPGSDITLNQ